ncbi:hypothetical protein [Pararhizobium antarcticum]|uniref:Uncharacterized protein n=1 Tax=Pararhizobium antarcticum TaxID=1798805 RepID=A0A657LL64_9HYPH|nr:hypothetical protein [Pararhizobium antarcticum]OJF89760.1 hypothetical protein AX760_24700 [Pararhizobium antarcticum]OJF90806.1 hypothetical protein AX761_22900 [Rhizobium sp. 58]
MISDVAAWLFAMFIIDPLQVEIRERLNGASVPVEQIQQSQQCIASHGPQLLKRAGEEPGWALSTAVGVAVGWNSPVELLDARDPNCSTLVRLLQNEKGRDGEA